MGPLWQVVASRGVDATTRPDVAAAADAAKYAAAAPIINDSFFQRPNLRSTSYRNSTSTAGFASPLSQRASSNRAQSRSPSAAAGVRRPAGAPVSPRLSNNPSAVSTRNMDVWTPVGSPVPRHASSVRLSAGPVPTKWYLRDPWVYGLSTRQPRRRRDP